MKRIRLTLIAIMLIGTTTLFAQNSGYYDDVYLIGRSNKKIERIEKKKKTEFTHHYDKDRYEKKNISIGIDEYNRRYREDRNASYMDKEENFSRDGRERSLDHRYNSDARDYGDYRDQGSRYCDKHRKKRACGKYSNRIARFHDAQTLTISGADIVNINFDDGYYGYDYDTYYYDDDFSEINLNLNFGNSFGWNSYYPWYDSWYYPGSFYYGWSRPYRGYYGPNWGYYSGWYDPWYSSWYYRGYYDPWYYPYYGGYYSFYPIYNYYSNARKSHPKYYGYSSRSEYYGTDGYARNDRQRGNEREYRNDAGYSSRYDGSNAYNRRSDNPYIHRRSGSVDRRVDNRNNSTLERVRSRQDARTRINRNPSYNHRNSYGTPSSPRRNNNPYMRRSSSVQRSNPSTTQRRSNYNTGSSSRSYSSPSNSGSSSGGGSSMGGRRR